MRTGNAHMGASMGQGSVMVPNPSMRSSDAVIRGAYKEGGGAAEMMPTPGVDSNTPAWGNNAYTTSSNATVCYALGSNV